MGIVAGRQRGIAYVLLATLGWSLSGIFTRLMPELSGWQINCWRGLWIGVALMLYLVLAHRREVFNRFDDVPFSAFALSAVCFAIGTTFYISSLTLTSTATVSVIGATSPLITALLSPWITGERPSLISWISAIIALGGAYIIARHGIEIGSYAGIALSLCVPFTFSLQTLLLRRYRGYDMMTSICAGGFLAFVITGFASLFLGHASAFVIDQRSFLLLMVMGPLQLAIPLIFYGLGARHVSAITLSLLAVLDAVMNPLWPWLFLGERPEDQTLIGGGIILGAVLLGVVGSQFFRAKAEPAPVT